MAVWPQVAWPTEPTELTTLPTPPSTDMPASLRTSAFVWPYMTTSTFVDRFTVAITITAATSTRCTVERPETGACMEADVSITTSVPSRAGCRRW
jgi:hypothetical protein